MPALKNPQQELFSLKLAEGMNQYAAYAAAGYRPCQQSSSRLARRPEIVARRAELLAPVAERMAVTVERLIAQAQSAYDLAMATQQPSAAVAAVREMGILAGIRVERRATLLRTVNELSDEELTAIAAGHGH